MIIEILLVVDLFLWFLSLLPIPQVPSFTWASSWLAWIAALLITLHLFIVGGFFLLAFAALLGFVDLTNSAAATFLGTAMGYAVGKMDPIMTRYYAARTHTRAAPADVPPASATPVTAAPAFVTRRLGARRCLPFGRVSQMLFAPGAD